MHNQVFSIFEYVELEPMYIKYKKNKVNDFETITYISTNNQCNICRGFNIQY